MSRWESNVKNKKFQVKSKHTIHKALIHGYDVGCNVCIQQWIFVTGPCWESSVKCMRLDSIIQYMINVQQCMKVYELRLKLLELKSWKWPRTAPVLEHQQFWPGGYRKTWVVPFSSSTISEHWGLSAASRRTSARTQSEVFWSILAPSPNIDWNAVQ